MFVIFGKGEKEKRKQEENWAAITDTIPDWGQFTELELSGPVPQAWIPQKLRDWRQKDIDR